MSRTTESIHIRGVARARLCAAVDSFLEARGLERVPKSAVARVERTEPELRRIALRKEGAWTSIADGAGFSGFGQASKSELDGWAEHLSRVIGRSVLTLWTWDGEANVVASRWKRGKLRARLQLLGDAYRDADGRARAPAKVLWPWLAPKKREAILKDGIRLNQPTTNGSTGDKEVDTMLEDFDEVDRLEDAVDEEDPSHVFVPLETSLPAIAAAAGIKEPWLSPWDLKPNDEERIYQPTK